MRLHYVSAVFVVGETCDAVAVATQTVGRSSALAEDQQAVESDYERARYKKVAIVEDFFDIIYNVHVEMDGRGGKHAGQKRTYRAVSLPCMCTPCRLLADLQSTFWRHFTLSEK